MSEQVLVQFRVDKALRQEVAQIYEAMGMDLPTALRMFLTRSKMERGLPFEAKLPDASIPRSMAWNAFEQLRREASNLPEMTLDEINEEISAIRKERRHKP